MAEQQNVESKPVDMEAVRAQAPLPKPIEPETDATLLRWRRMEYKLVLSQIMTTPSLLIEYAKMEKLTLRDAFLLLDKRIKELS